MISICRVAVASFLESFPHGKDELGPLCSCQDAMARLLQSKLSAARCFQCKGPLGTSRCNSGAVRLIACNLFGRALLEQFSKGSRCKSNTVGSYAAEGKLSRHLGLMALSGATKLEARLSRIPELVP